MKIYVTKPKWTRTTRTPAFWGYPPPSHDYPFYWVILDPKSKEDKVKVTNLKNLSKFWSKRYMRHTFCLIRCANMKWIRRVLLKIQRGHDSVHRRTGVQGETSIPPFNLIEAEVIMNCCYDMHIPGFLLPASVTQITKQVILGIDVQY